MIRKVRNTIIIVVVLVVIIAFAILQNVNEDKENTKNISGLVINKKEFNKENQLTIETFGEDEKQMREMIFTTKDKTLWNNIELGKYYFITYSEKVVKGSKKLIVEKVEKNDAFGKAYSEYMKRRKEKEMKVQKDGKSNEGNNDDKKEEKDKHIAIFPSTDKISTEGLTLLDSTDVDLNGDGKDEIIELYTTAQRDSSGEVLWDDGQKWFLIVKDKNKEYVLFDEYVQLGVLDYWIFTSKDECYMVTLQTGSAVFKLSEYSYVDQKDAFVKKDMYNPEFLNVVYGSEIK